MSEICEISFVFHYVGITVEEHAFKFLFPVVKFWAISWRLEETMLEVTCNDRLGKKVRVKCNPDDTIGDLKKLIAAQTGTRWEKIVLKKWYTIFKDHIKLQDYEIHDGMNLELYYQWREYICRCTRTPRTQVRLFKWLHKTVIFRILQNSWIL